MIYPWFDNSRFPLADYLQIDLSNEAEAKVCPLGWNLAEKISPSCPDSSIMAALMLDKRGGP